MKNNYLYQGNYAEYDEDIGWHDFVLRSYDAQLGRFWQPDPYDEYASGYTGMGNDPVNMVDPSGGWAATGIFEGMSQAGIIATTTLAGAIVGGIVDKLSGGDGWNGAAIGAGVGLASGISWGNNAIDIANVGVQVGGFIGRQVFQDLEQTEIERRVRQQIVSKDYHGAYRSIIANYPEINAGLIENKDYYLYKDILPGGGGLETQPSFRNEQRNSVPLLPTTILYEATFDNVTNGTYSFGLLVRMAYHEMVHVQLLLGKFESYGELNTVGHKKNAHETIAHYHMLKNATLPPMTTAEQLRYVKGVKKNYVPGLNSWWKGKLKFMTDFFDELILKLSKK